MAKTSRKEQIRCAHPERRREVSQSEVQPWHRLGGVEHICELRKNAQVLYGIFVTILRMIYSTRGGRTFGCPDVVWSADSRKTQLWIDTELRWEDTRPDFTPAIFVRLGEMKYEVPPTIEQQGRVIMSCDGEQSYERVVSGSATIVHVCDRAGAACSLADNTEGYLSSLQDQIRDEYCFDHLLVAGRVPRQIKDVPQMSGKGKYVSAVSLSFDFTDSWTVKVESPILKSVSMVDARNPRCPACGAGIEVNNGVVKIDFGDVSSEQNTPFEA